MRYMLMQCLANTSTWCATILPGQRMTTCTFRTSSVMVRIFLLEYQKLINSVSRQYVTHYRNKANKQRNGALQHMKYH